MTQRIIVDWELAFKVFRTPTSDRSRRDPFCPNCGAAEMHPDPKQDLLLVRAYKVNDDRGDWSHCLVCAGYYDRNLVLKPHYANSDLGWFHTSIPLMKPREKVIA